MVVCYNTRLKNKNHMIIPMKEEEKKFNIQYELSQKTEL